MKMLRSKELRFKGIEVLNQTNSIQFGKGSLSSEITFQTKEDLVTVAREVVAKQAFRIDDNVLHMRILRDRASFNPETSVFISSLNKDCREQHIITELNQIFSYNKTYRKELEKWDKKRNKESQPPSKKGKGNQRDHWKSDIQEYFVLSCLLLPNKEAGSAKRSALVDLDCKEAVEVVIKAWDQKSMTSFFNTLTVQHYTRDHGEERTEQRRQRSLTGGRAEKKLTNLYVESLPYSFDEQDVVELFSIYGDVACVKVKKPLQSLPISNADIDLLSCSAYVNFNSEQHAQAAKNGINGKSLVAGCTPIYVDFYQKENRFPGVHKGLNRQELVENSHFRVLYISGLYRHVTKRDLWTICLRYGAVDVVTLKMKIEDNQEVSKCKAIV